MPIERLIFNMLVLRRHWVLFILPLIAALPMAAAAIMYTPIKYEAKSTLLLLSANRGPDWAGGSAGFPRQSAIEQIGVLEVWLKSDQVLGELLPKLLNGPAPSDPNVVSEMLSALRRSLTLELIGAAVLEIRLEATEAKGLGRKLEIIVTRLLEGVLNPEAGILSAGQLIAARRADAVAEAEGALRSAIAAAGLDSYDQVLSNLHTIHQLKRRLLANQAAVLGGVKSAKMDVSIRDYPVGDRMRLGASGEQLTQQLDEARARISSDRETVGMLERLYEAYEEARYVLEEYKERSGTQTSSYVRVFEAPERITVVGRPRDPLAGKSSAWKRAIAVMIGALLASFGLMGMALLLDSRLRAGEDFEAVASVPVIARLPRVRRLGRTRAGSTS